MRLKPTCDVESIEDFRKYYLSGYVTLRDSDKVCLVHEVTSANGGQVILREVDITTPGGGGYILLDWAGVRRSIVFGKVPGGMVDLGGKVVYIWESNNRQSHRGFFPRIWRVNTIGGRLDPDVQVMMETSRVGADERYAWCTYHRTFTPIQNYNPTNGRAIAISTLWALAPHPETGTHVLYRRNDPVGHYFPEKRHVVLGPSEYKKYAITLSYLLGVTCNERAA
jgi:hypothetical protein